MLVGQKLHVSVIETCKIYAKSFRTNPSPLSSLLALQVSLRFTGNKTTYLAEDLTCDNFEYDLPDPKSQSFVLKYFFIPSIA